jgi:hypothetical protein
VALAYCFGALSVTADELFWLKIDQGSESIYYFPILGPWRVWAAWDLVFAGLGVCFISLVAVLSVKGLPRIHLPALRSESSPVRESPRITMLDLEGPLQQPSVPSMPVQAPAPKRVLREVPGTGGIHERTV